MDQAGEQIAGREIVRFGYLAVAVALFAVETAIALFVRDDFVRPYLGDVLAIALVYAGLRAIAPLNVWQALAIALTIALAIELAQAFDVLGLLGLRDNTVVRIVLGGVFDWADLAAYAAGALIVAALEWARRVE